MAREEWIEMREDDEGNQVEYLVTECSQCGQDWARWRIFRFAPEDLKAWQNVGERGAYIKSLVIGTLGMLLCFFFGVFLLEMFGDRGIASTAAFFITIGGVFLIYLWLIRQEERYKNTCKEARRFIHRNGFHNIPVDEVGTRGGLLGSTKYVILPMPESGSGLEMKA